MEQRKIRKKMLKEMSSKKPRKKRWMLRTCPTKPRRMRNLPKAKAAKTVISNPLSDLV